MIDERTLLRVVRALQAQSAKADQTLTLANPVLNSDRTSIVVDALSVTDDTWYPFCLLDFGGDIEGRVVRSVNRGARSLTWAKPLSSDVTLGATATLSSLPLHGAAVYLGGGRKTPRSVKVWPIESPIERAGIGHEYGSAEQQLRLVAEVEAAFAPAVVADFEDDARSFFRLAEQVAEVIEWGLDDADPIVVPTRMTHGAYLDGDGANALMRMVCQITCEARDYL